MKIEFNKLIFTWVCLFWFSDAQRYLVCKIYWLNMLKTSAHICTTLFRLIRKRNKKQKERKKAKEYCKAKTTLIDSTMTHEITEKERQTQMNWIDCYLRWDDDSI